MNQFGEKLRTLRKKRGDTLKELGDTLGVHHIFVSQVEMGKSVPNAALSLKIADPFGVSTDVLMRDALELDEG